MTVRRSALVALVVMLAAAPGMNAYLKLGADIGDRIVGVGWRAFPIRYFVTNRDVPGVTAANLREAFGRAFATWSAVPRVSLSSEFAGFADIEPFLDDNVTAIGFRARPDLDRTLAATTFTLDTVSGEILEADIFVNTIFNWSVSPGGEAGRHDLESVALHEIGHMLGLGHSGLGETELTGPGRRNVIGKGAVMFPIAFPAGTVRDRVLQPDDEAGIADLYGGTAFRRELGSISGRVTLNGSGVFGAHVVAFDPATQAMIGTFTLTDDGRFVIAALPPAAYVVRAEPIDDADVESFFDENTSLNLDFRPGYFERLVAVPAGGSGQEIQIRVQPK